MKLELRIHLCCLVLQASLSLCLAHDNTTVHPKITVSAAQLSVGLQNFLSEKYVDASGSVTNWLISGSVFEDVPLIRGFNHFYDPTKYPAIGLTDGFDWGAYPSFRWATEDLTQAGQQSFPWKVVRACELNALTNSSQVARQQYLEWMMFYLGHVIHLNQDLTVPAHVRNDNHGLTSQHGFWETLIMWTEIYGKNHYTNNPQWFTNQSHGGWAWWQNTAGFQKLEDFWNRGLLRTSGVNALVADARNSGRTPLGLSEFCNGNFISEDSPYGEFFFFHGKHWFQYPSLAYTTQPKLSPYNLADSVDTIELRNHKEGNRLRIRKTGAGIIVTNHSALNYLAVKNSPKLGNSQMQVTLTIHDDKVLQEYHEKLIPKAVEYSAGILDYFFRGTMDVAMSNNLDGTVTLTITNTSSQVFSGGSFRLFYDDTDNVRTELTNTNLSGTLATGAVTRVIFTPTNAEGYLLVYQGTIGITSGSPADPVDASVAIVVKEIVPPCGGPPAYFTNISTSLVASEEVAYQNKSGTPKVALVGDYYGDLESYDPSNNFALLASTTLPNSVEGPYLYYSPNADRFLATARKRIFVINPVTLAVENNIELSQLCDQGGYNGVIDPVSGRLYLINYTSNYFTLRKVNTFNTVGLTLGPSTAPLSTGEEINGIAVKNSGGQCRLFCAITSGDYGDYPYFASGYVKVYDGTSLNLVATYELPDPNGFNAAFNVVYDSGNDCLYVSGLDEPSDDSGTQQAQVIWVLNASTGQLKATIPLPFDTRYGDGWQYVNPPYGEYAIYVPGQHQVFFTAMAWDDACHHVIVICDTDNSLIGAFDNQKSPAFAVTDSGQLMVVQQFGAQSFVDVYTYP